MDPFTLGALLVVGAWALTGAATRDMVAIAKGQTPPSHAYRMAKLQAAQERAMAGGGTSGAGAPTVPASMEPRRIRIKDLARHWWEDALEDVDHWRASRRLSRPQRKAARKAWRKDKAALLKRGYELLKQRGQRRFATNDQEETPESTGDDAEVVDLDEHRRSREESPDENDQQSSSEDTPERDDRPELPSMEGDNVSAPSLSDGQTYAAHQQAFDEYIRYYRECAERQEAVADRLVAEGAEGDQVAKARAAATAFNEVADKAEAAKSKHAEKHQGIYEQRQAHTGAAEGRYLTGNR